MASTVNTSQEVFLRIKPICVPLLQASSLSPATIPAVLRLLTELINQLTNARISGVVLAPSLINYTFFPLSNIMQRNLPSSIPDQVLEKVFDVISLLCNDWWWSCDARIWEQIFILCGGVVGGLEAKGKAKQRDDPTKEAAIRCLISLLRPRDVNEGETALQRLSTFCEKAHRPEFVPIIGQTLNSLLLCTDSHAISLKIASLDALLILLEVYFPDELLPTVFPGVVSDMCKLSLGTTKASKTWVNSEIATRALHILGVVVAKTIGDDVCAQHGIIQMAQSLDDLVTLSTQDRQPTQQSMHHGTPRTKSWLQATASQLHIAMKTLIPLTKHPNASVLVSLIKTSSQVLYATPITFTQSQPLLLSFILSLTLSGFERVRDEANASLISLFSSITRASTDLSITLLRLTRDSLSALPRLIISQADAKVQHAAQIVQAVCRLALLEELHSDLIAHEVGKLLGPNGGIEKWGWGLLSAMEFAEPTIMTAPASQLSIENGLVDFVMAPFPEFPLRNVSDGNAYDALLGMFHALGSAAGESSVHSIEWFANIGQNAPDNRAIAALWCSCRLLEGVARSDIFSVSRGDTAPGIMSRSFLRFTREALKSMCRLWDDYPPDDHQNGSASLPESDMFSDIIRTRGVERVEDNLKITRSRHTAPKRDTLQPSLQKAMALQFISTVSLIQQSEFSPLLLSAIYPLLRSLVSSDPFLAGTAAAALDCVTFHASYASPANLLMSNFDYALDAVGRRLRRRWLDLEATKVLLVLIRITGSDIVDRAGDIVEECFDRLDDFHGYDIIVEGLVEVLGEVVKVIRVDNHPVQEQAGDPTPRFLPRDDARSLRDFMQSYGKTPKESANQEGAEQFGPVPQMAWGDQNKQQNESESENNAQNPVELDGETPPTPIQSLTKQIVSRSVYFLTHGAPTIRARILNLLASTVPVLPDSALLPSIHSSWPFILRRLDDAESFVVASAATLVEALVEFKGGFMFSRIWEDIWPRFHILLRRLEDGDRTSALARRGRGAVGTISAYTHSHRLYCSLLRSMTAAIRGVDPKDDVVWQVVVSFRRFLSIQAHEELQKHARDLYIAIGHVNADAVWLALSSTSVRSADVTGFMYEEQWDILSNTEIILKYLQDT